MARRARRRSCDEGVMPLVAEAEAEAEAAAAEEEDDDSGGARRVKRRERSCAARVRSEACAGLRAAPGGGGSGSARLCSAPSSAKRSACTRGGRERTAGWRSGWAARRIEPAMESSTPECEVSLITRASSEARNCSVNW